jgi:energy-coupling factor transporter ATP-binding protein EcfA2
MIRRMTGEPPIEACYDEPFFWWGAGWDHASHPDLQALLRGETIDERNAAILWAALARRRSVLVIGGPSGIGKTTLLTAFAALLPADTRRLYLRGSFETFAFLRDATVNPHHAALFINEISPHLPVYLWGPALSRVLDVADQGFALLATAHGESVPQFVSSLTGSPLRIPAPRLAAFEFVALLDSNATVQGGRVVRGVWRLLPTRQGIDVLPLATAVSLGGDRHVEPPRIIVPPPFPAAELEARRRALLALRDGVIEHLPSQLELETTIDGAEAGSPAGRRGWRAP